MFTKFYPLWEYIELSEVLHPLSASYKSLKAELVRDREKGLFMLLMERIEQAPGLKEDKTKVYFDLPEHYEESKIKQIREVLLKGREHGACFLHALSNDVRPYDVWVKQLDNQLKKYSDISPLQVRQEGELYWLSEDAFDLLTMGMSGRLFTYFDIYRARLISRAEKEFKIDFLGDFFKMIREQDELKKQAEKEWREGL